jgi:hypothetical protein
MRKTNPISPGRRRLAEEIVQNEAKLGRSGVCGKRQLSRQAWLGGTVKRAKRTVRQESWCNSAGSQSCPAKG